MKNLNLFQWIVIAMLTLLLMMSAVVLVQIFEIKATSPKSPTQVKSSTAPSGMVRTQEIFPVASQSPLTNEPQARGNVKPTAEDSPTENAPLAQTQPIPLRRREWTNEEIQQLIHSRRYKEYGVRWESFTNSFPQLGEENLPLHEGEEGLKVRLEFLEFVVDETTGQKKQVRIYPSRVFVGPGLTLQGNEQGDPIVVLREAQDLWFRPIFHGHGIKEPDPEFPYANPPVMIVPEIPRTFTVLVIYEAVQRPGEQRSFELTTDFLYDDPRYDKYTSKFAEYYDGYRITWDSFLQDVPIKRMPPK